jgi:hypothetical protein
MLAGAPGIEPGMAESKSAALPLGYAPTIHKDLAFTIAEGSMQASN